MMDTEYMKEESETQDLQAKSHEEIHIMYCGPNIYKFGLFQYQVFIGGYTHGVKDAMREYPEIEKLSVPVSEVDSFRAKIAKKGTAENLWYETVKRRLGE